MKVAVTTSTFAQYSQEPLEKLRTCGATPVLNPFGRKLTEAETIEMLADCDGVVAGTEPLTEKVMSACPRLKAISRCGVGMDNVDAEAAKKRGVAVRNTPFGPTLAVAELALGLALDLLRNVSRMDRELRAGTWKKRMGSTLQGKKLGVIGFGRIGRATARTFAPHGVEIGFYDPFVDRAEEGERMELDVLLAWADIVTLHCSKPEGVAHLLGERELALMREGAWLINAGRGGLVDESALFEALKSGRLAGAAVDVFEKEPYHGPLCELDNALLTPHIGSYARESRIQMELDAVENLLEALGAAAHEG
ncbi:MAG: D-3-phosphoglycerate dehydrogenase / 2-oxoglutarate reductase [Desulfovibrionales bacterium]|nr:D-3-phosphoglycerate dehydrogenase / 2-oxoglutarate reductase [Desulfovibrionales bacterium]